MRPTGMRWISIEVEGSTATVVKSILQYRREPIAFDAFVMRPTGMRWISIEVEGSTATVVKSIVTYRLCFTWSIAFDRSILPYR
jgi:hypothetical protein